MKSQEIRIHARKRLVRRFDHLSCYSDQIFDRKQLKVGEIYLGSQLEEYRPSSQERLDGRSLRQLVTLGLWSRSREHTENETQL